MRAVRLAVVLLAAGALLPIGADAGGRSGGSGGRSHSSSGGSSHHAHHHHGGSRVFVYYGFGYPYYYTYPAYYDPYGVPLYPPVPADPYWYYCRAANTYYPYINSCPGGWERYLPGNPG